MGFSAGSKGRSGTNSKRQPVKKDVHVIAVEALWEMPFLAFFKYFRDGWKYVSIVFRRILEEGESMTASERSNRGVGSPVM
jgi:hypothetical protein